MSTDCPDMAKRMAALASEQDRMAHLLKICVVARAARLADGRMATPLCAVILFPEDQTAARFERFIAPLGFTVMFPNDRAYASFAMPQRLVQAFIESEDLFEHHSEGDPTTSNVRAYIIGENGVTVATIDESTLP